MGFNSGFKGLNIGDLTSGLQVRASIPGFGKKVFPPNVQIASGAFLDSCTGYCDLFPGGVKQPKNEADHSPPSSGRGLKVWSYTYTLWRAQGEVDLYLYHF